MTVVEGRGPHGELYRWDFSRFFYKEYTLKRRTRFHFGHSVKVSRGIGGLWHHYTDPLYVRSVDGQSFDMQIAKTPRFADGDSCNGHILNPWLLPRRKSVLVKIHCEASLRSVDGIRSIRRVNDCLTEIQLGLSCPPRQTIFAAHLSVGTGPGLDDIVQMGQPRRCASNQRNQSGASLVRGTPGRFHISLSRDTLVFVKSTLVVDSALCNAQSFGHGVAVRGGVLHATTREVLQVKCTCARQARLATIMVTLSLLEYTSPSWSYLQNCPVHEYHE